MSQFFLFCTVYFLSAPVLYKVQGKFIYLDSAIQVFKAKAEKQKLDVNIIKRKGLCSSGSTRLLNLRTKERAKKYI